MPIGLVVVLRGGSHAVARPQIGVRGEDALEQRPQVRVLDRRYERPQVALHLLSWAHGAIHEVLEREASGLGSAQLREPDLGPVVGVLGVAAANADRLAFADDLGVRLHLFPDHRPDRARAIAECEAQIGLPVATLATLNAPHEHHLVDIATVR